MTQEQQNRALVERFWHTVYVVRDYDAVGRFFTEDGLYQDVSTSDPGGVGPAGVARRLRIGHEPVQSFDHQVHRMICQGDVVMTEHTETWKFHTGEVIPLPFVAIQTPVLSDGAFARFSGMRATLATFDLFLRAHANLSGLPDLARLEAALRGAGFAEVGAQPILAGGGLRYVWAKKSE